VVTICTTCFNIPKLCILPTVYLCVLYGSRNKQRLFPQTTLTGWWSLLCRQNVCPVRYRLNLYILCTGNSVFKGLTYVGHSPDFCTIWIMYLVPKSHFHPYVHSISWLAKLTTNKNHTHLKTKTDKTVAGEGLLSILYFDL
jgi:hypothetical protein